MRRRRRCRASKSPAVSAFEEWSELMRGRLAGSGRDGGPRLERGGLRPDDGCADAGRQPAPTGPTQTLREALVKTYRTNPTLMAQRQSLRSPTRMSRIARAAGRPQLSGHRRHQPGRRHPQHRRRGNGRDFSAALDVSMPLVRRRPGPQFGARRRHPGRGRPRRSARHRRRHLHRSGRRLHGRDSRPLDRPAQPATRCGSSRPICRRPATASRSAT